MMPTPIKMLIADDSRDVAERIAAVASEFGCETAIALDGAEAVGLLSDFTPQLAIIDLKMPGLDGFEVVRRFRRFDPHMFLVVMTIYDEEAYKDSALSVGANLFLSKRQHLPELDGILGPIVKDLGQRGPGEEARA